MRPAKQGDTGQHDLLRSRLDQIVDLTHPLARRWCTLWMEEEITSIHRLLSNDLLATDRFRASGRQHPVQDRHANGSLGLLGRETAGS